MASAYVTQLKEGRGEADLKNQLFSANLIDQTLVHVRNYGIEEFGDDCPVA